MPNVISRFLFSIVMALMTFGMAAISPAQPISQVASAKASPGSRFQECIDCPTMVVIPPGKFMMGSAAKEGLFDDEGVVHPVSIKRPFAIGMLQVTRGEYAIFAKETGRGSGEGCYAYNGEHFVQEAGIKDWRDPGFKQTDRDPVVCVNWNDAQSYVQWLNAKVAHETGVGSRFDGPGPYRLISEAEFEYAARAGSTTRYPWGDDVAMGCAYGNWGDQSGVRVYPKIAGNLTGSEVAKCDDGYAHTAPGGSFKPNAFGLYDMGGNVAEWLQDCYHGSYVSAPADGSAWTTGECKGRLGRGGAWANPTSFGRSAGVRANIPPFYHSSEVGFRVARDLD